MQPTPRALALETPIRAALKQIEQSLVVGEGFDPARSRQRFTVALTDYVELICMPRLLQQLSEEAPGVNIAIRHLSPSLPAAALDHGELDLVSAVQREEDEALQWLIERLMAIGLN